MHSGSSGGGRAPEEGGPDHGGQRADSGGGHARGSRGHLEKDQGKRHADRAVIDAPSVATNHRFSEGVTLWGANTPDISLVELREMNNVHNGSTLRMFTRGRKGAHMLLKLWSRGRSSLLLVAFTRCENTRNAVSSITPFDITLRLTNSTFHVTNMKYYYEV